jgi:integrase
MRHKRQRYQRGSLRRVDRQSGPSVWEFRYRDASAAGNPLKQTTLSTVQYPTKAKAYAALAPLLLKINGREAYTEQQVPTFDLIVERFIEEERLRQIKAQRPGEVYGDGLRYATAISYLSMIERHIRPRWESVPLEEMNPLVVQQWLKGLTVSHRVKGKKTNLSVPMAAKTRGHIKQFMHRLFEKAMLWEFLPPSRNPMDLVELRGVTKRKKKPLILTPEDYEQVSNNLPQPYRTMAAVAMCLGLRVSEVLALKWTDFDFDGLTVTVQRGIVHGRVADTKTEYSTDDLPLHSGFAELLKDWQAIAPQSEAGWVFVNPATGKPYHAAPTQQDYFRPAGQIAGLKGELGWHSFRHSYRSMLDAAGAPIGVQQKLMRHAQASTTMNYGNAYMEGKREAHGKVVQMVFSAAKQKATAGTVAS